MSHTRGKDQANPGKFAFECFDWSGNLFRARGGFDTAQAADRAAESAERDMMACGGCWSFDAFKDDLSDMSDDDLLRELAA